MAGCFGNHPIDRWLESQLDSYLNQGCDCEDCDLYDDCSEEDFTGCKLERERMESLMEMDYEENEELENEFDDY